MSMAMCKHYALTNGARCGWGGLWNHGGRPDYCWQDKNGCTYWTLFGSTNSYKNVRPICEEKDLLALEMADDMQGLSMTEVATYQDNQSQIAMALDPKTTVNQSQIAMSMDPKHLPLLLQITLISAQHNGI